MSNLSKQNRHNNYKMRIRLRRMAGLCTACGKWPPRHSMATCQICSDKNKKAYRANITSRLKKRAEYVQLNRSKIREARDKYVRQRAAEIRIRDITRTHKLKVAVISHYSAGTMKCSICPENRFGTLVIDHINNNGKQLRQSTGRSGSCYYQWLRTNNYPDGHRVLCANCNQLAYLEYIRQDLSDSRKAIGSRSKRLTLKLELMVALGGSCVVCGRADIDILTIHHINDNGHEHRDQISHGKGSAKFYAAILRIGDLSGLECRCMSCNVLDRYEKQRIHSI